MAEQSVYSAPAAELEMSRDSSEYDGFNRMQYFLFSLGIGVANLMLTMVFADTPSVAMICMLAAIVASVYIVVMRLKNVGSSAWWILGFIVPLLNIYVGVMCLAFPPGYQSHKQLDTAAKVIIGLFLGVFVLGIAAAVAVPMLAGA
jgi:uncharacterized membrane protein YhaH (DUF805 family)